MIKRQLVIGGLSGLLVLGLATPAFALLGSERLPLVQLVNDTVEDVSDEVTTSDDGNTSPSDRWKERMAARAEYKSQREQIEQQRQALKEAFEKRKSEIKERLEGKRLAACENRESKINELIDKGVENSRKRLAAIQRVEEGVKNFYVKQSLSSDDYEAAAALVDEKEAAAIAMIDTVAGQDFSCGDVDGKKPSGTLRDLHKQRREALKEYRQSVKDLIAVVREAFVSKQAGKE